MRHLLILFLVVFAVSVAAQDKVTLDSIMPIRGFCISAPKPDALNDFLTFMEKELAPNGINTLVLRVDYNYQFESYPNLRDSGALSKNDVKQMVRVAKEHDIRLIPQVNLLGHQSWAAGLEKLLTEFPQFDETPHVEMPEDYSWPNDDGLYCKSYCPLHPGVHEVVFSLIDEIVEVFETDAFHAGMDEVFYIGDDKCPRCKGKDKAQLFADEVNRIRDHLASKNWELWIWGDRMIDGSTTGMGMWEASMNNTHRSIDMISTDVVICDWHYRRAEATPSYFAIKGFRVVACPWNVAPVATAQVQQIVSLRQNSNKTISGNAFGVMQTIWTSARNYMDLYYGKIPDATERQTGQVDAFKAMTSEIAKLK